MELSGELRGLVRAYLEGSASLSDLNDWLGSTVEEIDTSQEDTVNKLSADVWRLVSEHDYGHRGEDPLRAALAELIEPQVVASGFGSGGRSDADSSRTIRGAFTPVAPGSITLNLRYGPSN